MGMHAACGHGIIMATSMAQLHMQAMTGVASPLAYSQRPHHIATSKPQPRSTSRRHAGSAFMNQRQHGRWQPGEPWAYSRRAHGRRAATVTTESQVQERA